MGKEKNFFILVGLLLLCPAIAHAASFDVKAVPIKDKIVVDEIAEFNVTVINNLDTEEEFTIKKAGYPFWDMYTKPLQNPITLKVPAFGSSSIRLFVDPLYITSVDTYTLDLMAVLERTSEQQKAPITIGIKSTEPLIGGYVPTVITSASISPEKIDPRHGFTIRIVLSNQNVIDYQNLTVKIESSLFKDELHVPLGPKDDKTLEIAKKLDDMTVPQRDSFVVAVFRDERLIVNPIVAEFEVVEYAVEEEIPKQESFLKIRRGIRLTSNNPSYHGKIKIEATPLKSLFLTSSPKAMSVKEDGRQYLVWDIKLSGNDTTVYTFENYRPILIIAMSIIAALVLYFLLRSPIIVKKGIANIGVTEGGVSEAKVVIRVKNRSGKQISGIEIADNLPHIAHVEKELSIGSMQPHAVLAHPKKGVMIKWSIEALEPGDERVLSYKMKSRLAILGEFNLPAATARAKVGNKIVISSSNRVSVGV